VAIASPSFKPADKGLIEVLDWSQCGEIRRRNAVNKVAWIDGSKAGTRSGPTFGSVDGRLDDSVQISPALPYATVPDKVVMN